MHRTTPVVTNTPNVSQTYKTAILSEFKGIDETVNPFSAVKNSAKECTNLYVDDEGTLVTRPRVEFVQTLPTNERYYKTFKLYDETQKWFWVSVYLKPFEVYVKDSAASNFIKYTAPTTIDIEEPTFFHNDQNKFVIGSKADGTSKLYVATFNFATHNITFSDPDYYIPTSQLYDVTSDSYFALNEQGNLWTSASSAVTYWSLDSLQDETFRKKDFEISKNDYYTQINTTDCQRTTTSFLLHDFITTYNYTGKSHDFAKIVYANGNIKQINYPTGAPDKNYVYLVHYDPDYDFLILYTHVTGSEIKLYIYKNNNHYVIAESLKWIGVINFKVDITNKVIMAEGIKSDNVYELKLWSYDKNGMVSGIYTHSSTDTEHILTAIDELHSLCLLYNDTSDIAEYINYVDKSNVKLTTTTIKQSLNKNVYYDIENRKSYFAYQSTYDEIYVIGDDLVLKKSENQSNMGTQDFLKILPPYNLTITLRPENREVDYGRIGESTIFPSQVEGENKDLAISINGNIIISNGTVILAYKSSTSKPLLYIDMPIDADPPKNINRVGRFNNNFVFWSTKSNIVYFTRYNDPTYIPASYYEAYGGANGVKGVLRISDEYLAVLKEDQAYITWTKDNLFYSNELRVHTGCSQEEACIVCNYSNLPIMVNNDGVWSLGQSSSVNYQDTVFGSISDRIDKGFTEYLPDKYILHNHKYYTYIGYNRDDSGIIWMYDNRINMWFKWVLPITITDFIEIDDVTYIVSTYSNKYNELYRLDPYGKQVDDDVQYLDEVHRTTPNYKNITWKWVSQPLPLNTLNYKKRIKYLKLIFANKYESDHITFKYWFRTYTQTEYPTNPRTYTAEITTLKTQKLKPRIPKFDFLQIILESNNDSDQFEDGVGNTVSTTLNDKIGFVSIALNYLLLEG